MQLSIDALPNQPSRAEVGTLQRETNARAILKDCYGKQIKVCHSPTIGNLTNDMSNPHYATVPCSYLFPTLAHRIS